MNLIRSSFKGIVEEMKTKLEEAENEHKMLGEIPTSLAEKRALFRSIREEIWKGVNSTTFGGDISSLHNGADMTPSARFLEASESFQNTLHSSKLATVSDIVVGRTVVAIHDGKEVRDEVCFVDDKSGKVYLKETVKLKGETFLGLGLTGLKNDKPGNIIQYSDNVYIERDDGTVDMLYSFEHSLVRPDPELLIELIKKNRLYKLPIFLNTDLFEKLVANHIEEEWAQPAMELLSSIN